MHYFIKNTRKLIIFSSVALVILAAFGYFSMTLKAQIPFDPKKEAEKDAGSNAARKAEELFKPLDIEEVAYSKDKNGCGKKSSAFLVMSNHYRSGASVSDVSPNKMFEPLVQGVYDKIKKVGIEDATLNNMIEYQKCIATAKPHKNAEREYDMSLKHDACAKLNASILDTFDSIKNRMDVNRVMDKYANEDIDFSGTAYEDVPDPVILFIGNLYNVSESSEYKDVVAIGFGISVACHM